MNAQQNIKMAVFDIDGTLLGRLKDKIEDSSVSAIHQLKAQGIQVMIATGRSLYFIKAHVREVLDSDYIVSINGHCLLDRNKQVLIRHDQDPNVVKQVYDLCSRYELALGMKTTKEIYVLRDYPTFYQHYAQGFDAKKLIIDNSITHDAYLTVEPAMGLFIIGDSSQILPELKKIPQLRIEGLGTHSLDVFGAEIDKVTGIDEVLKLANLSWENVIAFGDGNNDLGMLSHAGISIAMGNGTQEVKDVADFTTLNCDEGGIAYALKAYGLIP